MTATSNAAVSYTGGFYHVPIISTAARQSTFSDKVKIKKKIIICRPPSLSELISITLIMELTHLASETSKFN